MDLPAAIRKAAEFLDTFEDVLRSRSWFDDQKPRLVTHTYPFGSDKPLNYTRAEAEIATRLWRLYDAADLAERAERRSLVQGAAQVKLLLDEAVRTRMETTPVVDRILGGACRF